MDKIDGRKWWTEEHEDKRHQAVFARYRDLMTSNTARLEDNVFFARMYGGRNYQALTPRGYKSASWLERTVPELGKERPLLTYNLVQSVIDTKAAKLSSTTPRCMFVTDGGSWKQKVDAKKLTKAADGLAYETKLIAKEMDTLIDEEVQGTGVMFFYEENGKACAERVIPTELLFDDEEAFYGDPRVGFRWKHVSREVLAGLYPDYAEEIKTAAGPDDSGSQTNDSDLVLVVQAWHLRSGPDCDDGLTSICISNATLNADDESYEDEMFPFAFLIGQKRQVGFWGQGAAERLASTQWHLNKLYETIENQLEWGAVTRVIKRRGANLPNSHVRARRRIGLDVLEVDGNPGTDIVTVAPNPVPQQLLDREETLIRRGYQQEGVSEMDASARKPAGLDSAPAQREYHDIASQRFMRLGKALEQFHLDCIGWLLKIAQRIARCEVEVPDDAEPKKGKKAKTKKAKRGYKVRVPGKSLEIVDLADIDLPEDGYVMKAFPVSALPTTPAAKRQEVSEWISQGWIDPRAAKRLLDFPDLEEATSLDVAAYEDIEAAIYWMLEKGDEAETPEPHQDLQLGLQLVQLAYLKARREGAPSERLQLLRDWMVQAKALLDQQAAKQAAAAPPPAAPMGPGMPPAGPPVPPAAAPLPGGP